MVVDIGHLIARVASLRRHRASIAMISTHAVVTASHGTTKQALEELARADDIAQPMKTKMGRDLRKHRQIATAIKQIMTPYQCQARK